MCVEIEAADTSLPLSQALRICWRICSLFSQKNRKEKWWQNQKNTREVASLSAPSCPGNAVHCPLRARWWRPGPFTWNHPNPQKRKDWKGHLYASYKDVIQLFSTYFVAALYLFTKTLESLIESNICKISLFYYRLNITNADKVYDFVSS